MTAMSDVRQFGAMGDGTTDDTGAIRHAVEKGDGVLYFPAGIYRISGTIGIPLAGRGPCAVSGEAGTSTVVMAGAGPAFRLTGTHGGTGDPGSVKPGVWQDERMPTVRNIALDGAHPQADGFELVETMQAVFEGVMVRRVHHGIHLVLTRHRGQGLQVGGKVLGGHTRHGCVHGADRHKSLQERIEAGVSRKCGGLGSSIWT